ncbi:MAG: hypothetical protein Q4B92_03650 [Ruminococcus sp.]|nr:hypothetical protein [Ruminococcus sp.]MDO4419438.1 hypothetical protein [Ruminococcus sp.]
MGIFDKLKGAANTAVSGAVNSAASSVGSKKETFTFAKLPESVAELQALPEASLDSPFKTAALSLLALCAYGADKQTGIDMLNFLKGPKPLSNMEISFLDDRFRDGGWYIPFSYFKGATPENNYTPTEPYTLEVESNPYSATNEGYMTLWLKSGGADSPRQFTLRMKGDGRWFLWEQFVMVGIRTPKSQDPWA